MEYAKKLKDSYEQTKTQIGGASSIEDLEQAYTEAMDFYCNDLIPGFFSSRGEGRKIRDMYDNLETFRYARFIQESAVPTIDLNIASSAYRDYLGGMRTFIDEVCDCRITITESVSETVLEECKGKLETAKANDGKFIESIFGGCNNESHEETVLEASKNVEYLIDFMENVKNDSAQCGVTIDKIKKGIKTKEDETFLLEYGRLMVESMNDYCYHAISEIFQSYKSINDVLTTRGKKSEPVNIGLQVW